MMAAPDVVASLRQAEFVMRFRAAERASVGDHAGAMRYDNAMRALTAEIERLQSDAAERRRVFEHRHGWPIRPGLATEPVLAVMEAHK